MSELSIAAAIKQGDLPAIIAGSAKRSGVDFQYLMAQAQLESGMRPDAKARSSSATGLYQFIEQTWLGLVKEKGEKYGIGWAENAISQNSRGRYIVADRSQKSNILALRNDPALSANLAAEFAKENQAYLERKTGKTPQSVDLYLAHFLGPAGASKFLNNMERQPDAPAAPLFAQAARANRSIFYTQAGRPRGLQEIRDRFEQKLSNAVDMAGAGKYLPQGGKKLPSAGNDLPMVQPADYLRIAKNSLGDQQHMGLPKPFSEPARLAYLMLASLGMDT